VFAGGFDLESACAVTDSDDEFATLELLDALLRKSLIVADRSTGRTRYSMLETIRQFAEEQLVAHGAAATVRAAHAQYFAGKEADILALWDSPRQREAYTWGTVELANLRTAFRWAADHDDLDTAATIATCAGFLGIGVEKYEPIAWAEELIEPARAVDHPRLATLYMIASQGWLAGRVEAAVHYADDGQMVIGSGRHEMPFGTEGLLGNAYIGAGQPERTVEWCRAQLARGRDTHTFTRTSIVFALAIAGSGEEARGAATGLIDAAEATRNPYVLALALSAYGLAFRDADPHRAREARRRGLAIARDSGNRTIETNLAAGLSSFEAKYGDPATAFDYVTVAIRHYHESGNTFMIGIPLAVLAALFDRLGRHEPAATIAGFAFNPPTAGVVPEISTAVAHLRHVLGDHIYESLAREGQTMTTAAMARYAYDQMDQARTELNTVSK